MPARLAPDALRPTALTLPAPCAARSPRPGPRATFLGLLGPGPAAGLLGAGRTPERPDLAERRSGRRSGSVAAAACRPACGTAGPAAASLAPSLLLPAPSAVLGAPHALAPPPIEPARSFSFFGVNLCLLPDRLAHNQRRAETVGPVLLAGLRHSPYGATGCSWPVQGCWAAGCCWPRATRCYAQISSPSSRTLRGCAGLQGTTFCTGVRPPAAAIRNREGGGAWGRTREGPQAQLGIPDGRHIVGFLHCTHLHSPSEDGLLRRTQLTLLLDWAELSEVESRQSDEAVAFSVRLGDHNFDNCALRNAAEILQSPPLRGLPRGDAEGLGKEEGRRHSLAGPPRGGRPAEHWRAGAWTTSPTEEDPEAF
nr:LOW QUALITY PROTEIN: uncharacterized protein LOC115863423 [Globicephala melas]